MKKTQKNKNHTDVIRTRQILTAFDECCLCVHINMKRQRNHVWIMPCCALFFVVVVVVFLCCWFLLAFHLGCRGPSALTRHRTTIHHTANKGGISGWIQFARLVACIENLQWFGCSAHILSVCVENLPCYPPHLWMGAHQKPIALDIYYSVWYFMFFSCLLNMFGMQQHFRTHDYGKELQPRKRHTRSQRYLIMICYSMLLMRGQYAREQNNNRVKRNS